MSCGKSQDIDTLYKKYLIMSTKALFTLRAGAIPYAEDGVGKILYPIHPQDSEEVVKGKLAEALKVYAVAPHKFTDIQEEKIEKILAEEPEAEEPEGEEPEGEEPEAEEPEAEEPEAKPVKQLFGAAKKAAETKASKDSLD